MAHANARKHYRVAKKEVEQSPERGVFISEDKKCKLIIAAIIVLGLTFLKGFLFATLLKKQNKRFF